MAAEAGLSHTTIRRIWGAFGLQPHRSETFKLSADPLFVDKVQDIVGLYLSPPNRAVVLCVDEKSQIQALDREQPVLPMAPGVPERRTHTYVRNGTIDRVGYHDFEGITLFPDERDRMVASLGDKHVLVLRNHGIAVCERDIATTFMLLWIVQRAAEVQCQAGMIPGADRQLSKAIAERCVSSVAKLHESDRFAQLVFESQVRRMRQEKAVTWC